MHFFYSGSRTAVVNRTWLDQLVASSATPLGMQLLEEPDEIGESVGDA
jgi:hypothetical protein